MDGLESSGSYQVKGTWYNTRKREMGCQGPYPQPWSEQRQTGPGQSLDSSTFDDSSSSLSSPGSRRACGKAWGEHKAYYTHHPACHLACNVTMHCVSRNLECPALSVGSKLPDQLLSLSSREEPGGTWLSPDRTRLALQDSDG